MRKFTSQEDQFLRDHYLTVPAKRMAKMLGRSEGTARQRMKVLGIVVPPEIVEQFRRASQIKPGNVPHNKGKKMSDELRAKVAHTWFQKGLLPHNTAKADGEITIRKDNGTGIPYRYIRLSLGNWELLHRHIWRQHNGEIPDGHIVVFKDGDQSNCDISNLELITLKDNMRRNTIHRYPEELHTTIRLISKIKKIAHEKQNSRPK